MIIKDGKYDDPFVQEVYEKMYPQMFNQKGLVTPLVGYTYGEVRTRPIYSEIAPHEVDLSTQIGPVRLNVPVFSAIMDTVSGPDMGKALFEVGGCCILTRHKKAEIQLGWAKEVLNHKPCLVANPKCLRPDETLADANDILENDHFSTIPIVSKSGILRGILFTGGVAFKKRLSEPVARWMTPLAKLKFVSVDASFEEIRDRLLNESDCSVLPVLGRKNRFEGIYFMKDFFVAEPSYHKEKPLVGIGIGVSKGDLERVRLGLELGVSVFCIDSSHGDCPAVIKQAEEIVKIVNNQAAVIAGNVADIGGYCHLAQAGVHGVKCNIGSGAPCTTSEGTGVGVPTFTLLRELNFMRRELLEKGLNAPAIIPDGGINGPGAIEVALTAGGDACMTGEWLVGAQESLSYVERGVTREGTVYYRGMAAKSAINARVSSDRYGQEKRASEGKEGYVPYRGPFKNWAGDDIELIKGGLAHIGARNILEAHEFAKWPMAFTVFTLAGQSQIGSQLG